MHGVAASAAAASANPELVSDAVNGRREYSRRSRVSDWSFCLCVCVCVCVNGPDGDEDHGEDEVLSEQRHHQTGGRDDLDDQQEEHVQTNEDRDGQRHLATHTHDATINNNDNNNKGKASAASAHRSAASLSHR